MEQESIFVVAYDFSTHADAALYAAVDLAKRFEAEIRLLHVIQNPTPLSATAIYGDPVPPSITPQQLDQARTALARVAEKVALPTGAATPHVVEGLSVDRAILDFCEEHEADLLIMGTHGRTGVAHVFLGSVAERTLRRAPCPVMTVQAPEPEETERAAEA